MITRKRIRAEKAAQAFRTRTQDVIVPALVGDGAGNVEVTGRAGWVWVRLNGSSDDVAQALNRSASALVEDAAVDLKRVRRYAASYYEIVSPSDAILYDVIDVTDDAGQGVKKHAAQHIRADGGAGGSDPLDVHARMVVPLRARAQASPDMTLYVEAGYHAFGYFAGGNSPTFTAPTGAGIASRVDLLYIGSDNALHVLQGTATGYGVALSYPALPSPCVPIAFVRVDKGLTAITEAYIVRDARMLSGISPAVYGLTGLLDATAHSDTVTGAPIAGDLIYANATPQWTRLAANATATNKFLRSVSAGVPSWQQVDYADLANVPSSFPIATPGSLNVSSTNVAAGNHTHAVTSSSDVSAGTSAILASSSGALKLQTLNVDAGYPSGGGTTLSARIMGIISGSSTGAEITAYDISGNFSNLFGANIGAVHYGGTITNIVGVQFAASNEGGTASNVIGVSGQSQANAANINSNVIGGLFTAKSMNAGTTVGNLIGLQSILTRTGGTVSLAAGLWINDVSGIGATNNYAIYADGGKSYHAGHVLIGTTTDAGTLTVNGEIAIADGMTAPSATSGYAKIYVDSGDGLWKAKDGDGNIFSTLSAYGSMYGDDISQSVTIASAGVYYEVGGGLAGGTSLGMTFQSSKQLLCTIAGKYKVDWSMSLTSSNNNENISGAIMVNSTAQDYAEGSAQCVNSTKPIHVSGSGIVALAVNDVLKLCVENEDAAHNITVLHANLTAVRIGD